MIGRKDQLTEIIFDSILIIKFKEAFVSFLNPYFTIKRFCDKKKSQTSLHALPPFPLPSWRELRDEVGSISIPPEEKIFELTLILMKT